MKSNWLMLFCIVLFAGSIQAREISGVHLEEKIDIKSQSLALNGAGIRTKFIFDIYVAAFYTADPVRKVSELKVDDTPMRMAMHFIYDEVSKDKLVDAWNEGFEDNLTEADFEKLKSRIKLFNSFFETAHAGDIFWLDYIPAIGTSVYINKKHKGTVTGSEFYRALLMIWLGDEPVTDSLKQALLGKKESDDE